MVLSTLVVASPTASAQESAATDAVGAYSNEAVDDTGVADGINALTDSLEDVGEAGESENAAVEEPDTADASEESDSPTASGEVVGESENSVEPENTEITGDRSVSPSGIEVDITEIENPTAPGGQLQPGDSALIKGTWKAPDDAKAGDSFQITLPDVFGITPIADFPLVGDDGESSGTCHVDADAKTLKCTLNETVNDLTDVHGEWELYVTADKKTRDETVTFPVEGGQPIVVKLPGENGGIGKLTPLPTDVTKSGRLDGDQRTITWTVDLPGSYLADANDDIPLVFPDTPSTNGMKLVDGSGKLSYYEEVKDNNQAVNVRLLDGGSLDLGTQNSDGKFNVTVNPGTQTWDPNKVYRVQYQTKTDALLPPGTELSNTVGIGGEGVTSSGALKPTWKTGKFVEPDYQAIEWTILAPAKSAVDGTLTITDNLGEQPHEATADTPGSLVVSGADVNGTPSLTVQDSKNFTISIPVSDEVKNSDAVFIVKYKTYYAGTDTYPKGQLPQGGIRYTNQAKVGDVGVSGSTTTPNFKSTKDGKLNTEPVTIGGVTHPINSTMNWTVNASGNDIADLQAPITITDTLSGPHQVCEGSGSLIDRLDATVSVYDRVTKQNVPETVGLEATQDSNGAIKFVLKPSDINRGYVYKVNYTTCTQSGGQDSDGTSYGNSVEGSGIKTNQSVSLRGGGSGTATGVSQGSFSLKKQVSGTTDDVSDLEFTVKAEEFKNQELLDANQPDKTYEVKVKADGTPVSGNFSRGNGWLIRLSEIKLPPAPAGTEWGTPQFMPSGEDVKIDDQGRAIVKITPRENVNVVLKNVVKPGEVKLTKKVEGDAADQVSDEFLFKIVARLQSGQEFHYSLSKNQTITVPNLPIGQTVTFSELTPENSDSVTWAAPKFEPSATVKVGETAAVTLTNTANKTQGTFSIKKDLKVNDNVPDDATIPNSFVVNASWTDADGVVQTKPLTVAANGDVTEFGQQLPAGTVVTLEEVLPENGGKVQWADPSFSGEGVKIVDGKAQVTIGLKPVKVTVKNVADLNDGTLRLTKLVSGEAAEAVTKDVKFEVEASWKLPGATDYGSKTLTVHNGEIVDLGVELPVGTEVTFKELSQGAVDKVQWGTINWGTDPSGATWLKAKADGTATGIVSDDPTIGRLITLTNEALWKPGAVSFEKQIVTDKGEVSVEEAVKDGIIPENASFDVKIKNIVWPAGKTPPENAGIAVGNTLALNKDNRWVWTSEKVLPKGTKVTFDEVTPENLPGIDWGKPEFDSDTVEVGADETAVVKIKNTPIPTTPVDVDKSVTGPKGKEVEKDDSSTFQVKASWTAWDGVKTCIFNVVPGKSAVPAEGCEATIIDGKVYFPRNTEITFEEVGQNTDVPNVKWQEVLWTIAKGKADITVNESEDETKAPTATVTITGDKDVTIGLENKTSSNGLIIIPIPIPLPPFPGGSSNPPTPNTPVTPGKPGEPTPGKPGHPGKPMPQSPSKSDQAQSAKGSSSQKGLARTGANVIWLAGGALLLLAAGAFLITRNKKRNS